MQDIENKRHTLSHILAAAVQDLYPDAKFGIGPAIDDGFYYDIDFGNTKISDSDLKKIEQKMRQMIKKGLNITRQSVSRSEALKWAKANHQPYKLELIEELPEDQEITFYDLTTSESKTSKTSKADQKSAPSLLFADLCKGPHATDLSHLGVFQLSHLAGAYWRGDEKRPMLTRIYGLAFDTEEELKTYLKQQEEAKSRDHRKLGRDLDLFCYSPLVGSGLPLFTPRGTILRDLLNDLSQSYRLKRGYQKVTIPHIANIDLYKTSGHFEKFPEMFQFISKETGDHLAIKPVSCPHHSQIFASSPRSYKDLPIKYLETTMVYRDERKGELGGLSRVRAITQDDSHVFCTEDQVPAIFGELIESAQELYQVVKMDLSLRLSFRDDGDGYIGTPEMWTKAEQGIKAMADKFNIPYEIGLGEAAMYGPKMDFMATDALGRKWQLATVQLDYALPTRFKLEYTAQDGSKQTPIMVHCALVGSIERFMSVYLEHTAGWLPLWCAPENVRVLTVNSDAIAYARKITSILDGVELSEPLPRNKLRYSVDAADESLGKKIRRASGLKIPAIIIAGPKDAKNQTVSLRLHDREETIKLVDLADFLKNKI